MESIISGYSVEDEAEDRTVSYYRLRQYDVNGEMKDEWLTSSNCALGDLYQFTVYPNPTSSDIQVVLNSTVPDKEAFINLSNLEGRTILNQSVELQKGNNAFHLNLETLPPGVYIVHLQSKRIGLLSARIVKTD